MVRQPECSRVVRNDVPNRIPSDASEILRFGTVLLNESDRGCVLAVSAYLEESVRESLCARCQELSEATDSDLGKVFKDFDSQFASFVSCIRLAFALGVIDREMELSLREFAAMRNGFAHRSGPKRITEHQVRKVVDAYGLSYVSGMFAGFSARQVLINWAVNVDMSFRRGIKRMKREARGS